MVILMALLRREIWQLGDLDLTAYRWWKSLLGLVVSVPGVAGSVDSSVTVTDTVSTVALSLWKGRGDVGGVVRKRNSRVVGPDGVFSVGRGPSLVSLGCVLVLRWSPVFRARLFWQRRSWRPQGLRRLLFRLI